MEMRDAHLPLAQPGFSEAGGFRTRLMPGHDVLPDAEEQLRVVYWRKAANLGLLGHLCLPAASQAFWAAARGALRRTARAAA